MRDVFEDLFSNPTDAKAPNPMEAARRAMRPPLRRRFYRQVDVTVQGDGFAVVLDGRPVRTPGRRTLSAPTRPLADAIAGEWSAQQDLIDPAAMPLTRLANAIIDGVMPAPAPVAAEIEKYLASDLMFYRAAGPRELVALQARHWDPIIAWAQEMFGARFALAEGVMHVQQQPEALAAAASAIPIGAAESAACWKLGALNVATTLTGSALLAFALAAGRLDIDAVWAAAHVDEDWNMAQWGRDELALQRRAYDYAQMQAAAQVLALLR